MLSLSLSRNTLTLSRNTSRLIFSLSHPEYRPEIHCPAIAISLSPPLSSSSPLPILVVHSPVLQSSSSFSIDAQAQLQSPSSIDAVIAAAITCYTAGELDICSGRSPEQGHVLVESRRREKMKVKLLLWGACNHAFHLHCILKWVNSQTPQAHCPMCRREWQFKG